MTPSCFFLLFTFYFQAPTYQIGSTIIWGQGKFLLTVSRNFRIEIDIFFLFFSIDKVNVVADLVGGWDPKHNSLKATVAGFPYMDYKI